MYISYTTYILWFNIYYICYISILRLILSLHYNISIDFRLGHARILSWILYVFCRDESPDHLKKFHISKRGLYWLYVVILNEVAWKIINSSVQANSSKNDVARSRYKLYMSNKTVKQLWKDNQIFYKYVIFRSYNI